MNELGEEVYVFPVSFSQRRLWFIEQLIPGNPFYNVPMGTRLIGPLDTSALERSLNEIVRRHEALRTTFNVSAGEPVQVVLPHLSISIPVIDLSELPEHKKEAELKCLSLDEDLQPFDLTRAPLVRAKLIRLGAEEHVLFLTMHHIISDGWSLEVLLREVRLLYEAFAQGRPSPLGELQIQYADFALWQQEQLQGELLDRHLIFWKQHLAGITPLTLPTDRPHPEVQSFRGDVHKRQLPVVLMERLAVLSQEEGTTLFMTTLAAFKVLLQRYTGQNDISVGTPIANRNRAEIEDLIGFFVNTLIMRTNVTGELTFRQLLRQVRETALGAYDHQDLPFEKLVEELQPEREVSRTPFVQTSFALHNAFIPPIQLAGLQSSPFEKEIRTTRFELEVNLVDTPQGLQSAFVYSTDLFDAQTIERMAAHFEILLEGIVANPDQRLAELPLLTKAEVQQLQVEWNETGTEYPRESTIAELFAAQVGRRPQATAVVCGERDRKSVV